MLREPGAPFLAAGYIQRLAYFHLVLSTAVEDNERRLIPLSSTPNCVAARLSVAQLASTLRATRILNTFDAVV
jgi:hypothetical protein